jgi:hypothetical protein
MTALASKSRLALSSCAAWVLHRNRSSPCSSRRAISALHFARDEKTARWQIRGSSPQSSIYGSIICTISSPGRKPLAGSLQPAADRLLTDSSGTCSSFLDVARTMAFMMGKGYHAARRHWWFNCSCCALTHRDSTKVGREPGFVQQRRGV